MPTQSPTPLTPKGPRNNRRNQKKTTTPSAQNASTLATPPSSPPRTLSPRDTTTDSSGAITLSKKKGNRSTKKPRDTSRMSPVNKSSHRHASSHPNNNITTPHLKDTHYAGPTFHASPAPSALPIPSFFSKSFPDSDLAPTLEHDSDSFDVDGDLENTPSKPKSRPLIPQEERESTPLDFLFKAAVEARRSQSQQSPESSPRGQSPQTDSKAIQTRQFANDTSGMFPLEMGGQDLHNAQIGPSFAPSYRDRMNALRSASSPSPTLQGLNEDERKAKTEALKSLLLNPRPQRPSSTSHSNQDPVNHAHKRPGLNTMVPHFATPLRTSSGPPIINPHADALGNRPPHSVFGPRPVSQNSNLSSPQNRQLRDSIFGPGILASNPGNAPSTPRQAYGSPSQVYPPRIFPAQQQDSNFYPQLYSKSPGPQYESANANSPVVDTKKIEDDLRRVLKLDANPGIQSSSIQSSLA